jgi:hypothetical protein
MFKYTIRYLRREEFTNWDEFVETESSGTFFNTTKHLHPLCEIFNLSLEILACFDANDRLIGGVAHSVGKKYSMRYMYQLPLTPVCYPVIQLKKSRHANKVERNYHEIAGLIIDYLERRIKHIHFSFPPGIYDVRPYTFSGFHSKIHYSFITKLTNSEEIISRFDSDVKRRIKIGLDKEYKFEKTTEKEAIKRFYNLQNITFQRQGVRNAFNINTFTQYFNSLPENKCFNVYLISTKKSDISGAIVVYDEDTAYYLMAATNPDYFNTNLNHVLMKCIIEDLCQNSALMYFDLVGANTPTIAKYKSTLNFDLAPQFHVYKDIGFISKTLFKLKKYF